jgi:hypothetical protein
MPDTGSSTRRKPSREYCPALASGLWLLEWNGVDPKFVCVMVFLGRATTHNGCRMVIAGSHQWSRQEHDPAEVITSYKQGGIQKIEDAEKGREHMATDTNTKQHILEAFQQLFEARKPFPSRMAIREEVAEKARDKRVVETVSTYTVERVVKGLAELQLHFGTDIDGLAARLSTEIHKLEDVRRAIEVETSHFEELRHIKMAAEALNILTQDHQETARTFAADATRQRETLERDIAEKRQAWQKEQEGHEQSVAAYEAALQKERQQEEETYQYGVERKRKIETDAYEEKKKQVEVEFAETAAEKDQDWARREAIFAGHQQWLEPYKAQAQTFPQERAAAVQQAREEAIKAAQHTAKVRADLFQKEEEANRKVHEAEMQTLNDTLRQQQAQIDALSTDFKAALKQVQELSAKAIGSTANTGTAQPRDAVA